MKKLITLAVVYFAAKKLYSMFGAGNGSFSGSRSTGNTFGGDRVGNGFFNDNESRAGSLSTSGMTTAANHGETGTGFTPGSSTPL